MSEIVERVTRKLHGMNEFIPLLECERLARGAIEAMREPTEEMWKAEQPTWSLGRPMWDWWRSMIDEALK